jgi:hypothetical protein
VGVLRVGQKEKKYSVSESATYAGARHTAWGWEDHEQRGCGRHRKGGVQKVKGSIGWCGGGGGGVVNVISRGGSVWETEWLLTTSRDGASAENDESRDACSAGERKNVSARQTANPLHLTPTSHPPYSHNPTLLTILSHSSQLVVGKNGAVRIFPDQ